MTASKKKSGKYSDKETEKRFRAALIGARVAKSGEDKRNSKPKSAKKKMR